ncbi:PAS domain-containing sensor histidine kinase [Mucilaginibacter celer]|uniref:histidine kinase n=1 Tax=Mucilaginibacter celer TaxID=2305508 RepID=A0A494VS37_9SPHI|nr:PAS domain S-box protein [Mucilaginibacter celer]AYL97754.1 PAS domain S-box protein [Mucilaginibacter celer]
MKQDPNSLTDSEKRYRALVIATSDVMYTMSADWQVMYQLHGGDFLSDTGEPMVDWMDKYIHPKDRERVQSAIAHAIRTKTMFQLEHQVVLPDGSLGWTYSRAVPILDEHGEITQWFGAANDVTNRKRTEDALRIAKEAAEQQKRLYETITSNTPDLIYVFDLDYRFTYANDALLTMWGKTWDNAIGKNLLENGYEPWHAEMHEREIDKVVATRQPIRGEVSFPHATLGRRVYDYIFSPVVNELDKVVAIAGTTRDITDIRLAERTLTESEARFRTMAEGTNIYISMGDETGNAIYFNQAWSRLTGRSMSELIGFDWVEMLHPDDRENYLAVYNEAFKARVPFHTGFRVLAAEGDYRWLLTDGSVRRYNDGSFAGFIGAAVDITELKQDEQRKNDFISMVSHELKTPLTSALAYVQVSKKRTEEAGDAVSAGMLDRTEKQLTKMARMINGFLNVSRLESGKIQIDCRRFDLAGLMKETEDETLASVSTHRLLFASVSQIWVNADREKIGQVIQNLISNAVKYSQPNSTIRVSADVVDGKVQISVSDEGIGISQQDLPRLFERFYRVKDAETRHIAGFGIGLYLCSEIVKQHGGRIRVESTVGEGSTFYFTLPVV